MIDERVVDIWFPDSKSFGSGYLLTDRLILTAGHVVKPFGEKVPCIVRRLKVVEGDLPATAVWVSEEPDAALIQLDKAMSGALGRAPTIGQAVGSGAAEYECVGRGFPRANKNRERERIDMVLRGTASFAYRSGQFQVAIRDIVPSRADGWSGISGAALFSRGALLAIATSVKDDWGGTSLNATSVSALMNLPGFRRLVECDMVPIRPVGYYSELSFAVRRYYCFVDRSDQEKAFQVALGQRAHRAFYIPGETRDRPELLIERFAQDPAFRSVLGDLRTDRAIIELRWPSFRIADPDQEFDKLKQECAQRLSLPPGAAADPESFREALSGRGPAAIWWLFKPQAMGPGHGRLLKLWTEFCAAAAAGHTPFYWFACCMLDGENDTSDWRARFTRRPQPDPDVADVTESLIASGNLVQLDELNPIGSHDVPPWLERIAEPVELDSEAREEVCACLDRTLGTLDLNLAEFGQRVEAALKDQDVLRGHHG